MNRPLASAVGTRLCRTAIASWRASVVACDGDFCGELRVNSTFCIVFSLAGVIAERCRLQSEWLGAQKLEQESTAPNTCDHTDAPLVQLAAHNVRSSFTLAQKRKLAEDILQLPPAMLHIVVSCKATRRQSARVITACALTAPAWAPLVRQSIDRSRLFNKTRARPCSTVQT